MRKTKHKTETIVLSVLFITYLFVLFKITVFRGSDSGEQTLNLIPFSTIVEYLVSVISGNKIIGLSNLLGNLVMFFPLGYMSASLFPKMRKLTNVLILSFAFSVVIEMLQYIFMCGSTDIDDVILNILGGIIGYGIHLITSKSKKPKIYAIVISALMITVTFIGMYSFGNYKFLVDRPQGELPLLSDTVRTEEQPDHTDETTTIIDDTEWYLIIVNKWNLIPNDYDVELTKLTNGESVDKRIYPALQEMFDAARSEGIYPIVVSGYRTAEKQQALMNEKIAYYKAEGYSTKEATAKAEAWVAIPGTSEHQIGIAVDINADDKYSTNNKVYGWLEKNAHKYGFIYRYPPDKTDITGVIGESWHYRYVGVEVATEIYNRGICLEEYLDKKQ